MLPQVTIPRVDTGPFDFGQSGGLRMGNRRNFASWRDWLRALFPEYIKHPFGQRHIELWQWVTALRPGVKPRPFCALWPRGGAKSTSAELATVYAGDAKTRSYIWYVSSTQDKADKHVENIGSLLESRQLGRHNPALSSRKVGKYGSSKGWRRNRLKTASGLTIDALGLDTGTRGGKDEERRPDLIIFDDVDEKHDSMAVTRKKIETITTSILPAGSSDCAVLFIQNIIREGSIADQLAHNADFMIDRIVSGPIPAVEGLAYEVYFDDEINRNRYRIIAGTPTWEGQSLETCQSQINDWGLTAFLAEAQHEVTQAGGIWDHIEFRHCKREEVPELVRGCVWCDPAVTSNEESCANGIIADGLGEDRTIYRVFAWEGIDTPTNVIRRAIRVAIENKFGRVGVETNQGGDLWRSTYYTILEKMQAEYKARMSEEEYKLIVWPAFAEAKAGTGTGGKVERNQLMLADYEKGAIVHVIGTHEVLERALKRFPNEPLDLADAAFWGWYALTRSGRAGL